MKNKKEAINILTKQQEKLSELSYELFQPWRIQTTTYIKDIFGEQSKEYSYINDLGRINNAIGIFNENQFNKRKNEISVFLKNCIETIIHIRLYKPPKNNFLSEINNQWLISIIVGIIAGMWSIGFVIGQSIGQRTSEIKNMQEITTLKDSISRIRPPLSIPDSIPHNNTNSNKDNNRDTDSH